MITLKVKLYSILRQQYGGRHTYDAGDGIRVELDCPIPVTELCGLLEINVKDVVLVTINGKRCEDLSTLLQDCDEVGMHPQFPSGG